MSWAILTSIQQTDFQSRKPKQMKKNLLTLTACLTITVVYCQNGAEKELIKKYDLPSSFFSPAYNAKEYIVTHYDSISRSNGKNILPPEDLVIKSATFFMRKEMFDKAYWLLRMNIDNYPNNYILYQQMADYYKAKGDKDRSFVYYSKALVVKYKEPSLFADSLIKFDTEIIKDYDQLSKNIGRKTPPPQYLVRNIANNLIRLNKKDKAMILFKMNYENNPENSTALDDMGDYYENLGDSIKAFEYWARAASVQNKLPDNFFNASFNPVNYLNSFYSKQPGVSGEKTFPPEQLVNWLGYVFLSGKMFDKAEMLFKLNIENYPKSSNVFDSMADYYEATGNKEKENEFRQQFEKLKPKNSSTQQNSPREVIADTAFDTQVAVPICQINCPVILFDEAHNNYHKATGRYKPFARLMENDGFRVIRSLTPFTKELLGQANVVVIASPGAINVAEIQILKDWIQQGGSLLAITDHDNFTIDELLYSVGAETQEISITLDSLHSSRYRPDGVTINPGSIYFSETDRSLGNHSILRGRNDSEKIKRVQTFAGRTVVGPDGSSALLPLSESAIDFMVVDPAQPNISRVAIKTKGLRTHGVAFNFGKGKVVVLGEAAMITAQLWPPNYTPDAGMNVPGSDNKQFALNIMRWLTGYLK